jgi:hypothetical protein
MAHINPGILDAQDRMDQLKRMMTKAHDVGSHTNEELAAKWAKNISFFLYRRCREFSPTAEQFGVGENSIAVKHKWKIANLKNHVKLPSPWAKYRVADIMRQRRNHRMFIASGWLGVKKIVSKKSGERLQSKTMRNGAVIVEKRGWPFVKIKVSVVNMLDFARPFHEKHNIVQLALEDESKDLAQYIALKTHGDAQEILRTT